MPPLSKPVPPIIHLGCLPDDGITREVVGYGRLRQRPGLQEVQVAVQFATLRPNGAYDPAVDVAERWVGCGQLPIVAVGSRWRGRRSIEARRRSLHTGGATFFDLETIGKALAVKGMEGSLVPSHPHGADPRARCFLLRIDDRKFALLPVLELVRALFGCTSGFLKQTFDGLREPLTTRRGFLFDRRRSRMVGKTVHIYGHSKPTEREAWAAAMIMASRAFRMCHDGVFQNLQVSTPNPAGHRSLTTSFPAEAEETIGLAYESVEIAIAEGSQHLVGEANVEGGSLKGHPYRELITRIVALDMATPFETVEYTWPKQTRSSNLPSPESRTMHSGGRCMVLVNDVAPGTLMRPLRLSAEEEDLFGLYKVAFIAAPRITGVAGHARTLPPVTGETSKTSTADPHGQGDREIAPLQIEVRAPRGTPGAIRGMLETSLIRTDEALRSLEMSTGWLIDGLSDDPGTIPWLRPIEKNGRMIEVAEYLVETPNGTCAVYDAGTTPSRSHALGVIRRVDRASFTPDCRKAVHAKVLEWGGHWDPRRSFEGYAWKGLSRSLALMERPDEYAAAIKSVIDTLMEAQT